MPTIVKADTVLVSGANGYVAMWVVRTLLERGYAVRGTVRNETKAKFLTLYFGEPGYSDKLESVIVEDILKDGAFDEAVKGVDAIAHTASPFNMHTTTPDGCIKPAVQGTLGMLSSALKHGTKVKRINVTSSCGAVGNASMMPKVFSETDWEEDALRNVAEQGDKSSMIDWYRASKTLAEKAVWQFTEKHKEEITWDLSVINPCVVFGPPIHDANSMATLNLSLQVWLVSIASPTPKSKEELLASDAWVDVRDTALAHVLALENSKAGGEHIIAAAGMYTWQEWIDVVNSLPNNPVKALPLSKGNPDLFKNGEVEHLISYNISKEQRILGLKYHSKLEAARDTLEEFSKRGW